MRLFKNLLLVIVGLTTISCGTIKIKSTPPEADVSVILPGKEKPKPVGKTPFESDISDLSDLVNVGPVVIVVKKEGYLDKNFILPNISGSLELDTTLSPNLPENYLKINKVVALVLKSERLLLEKRYDEAIASSEEIKNINQNITAAYEISGSAYFMKKNYKKSKYDWQRSLEIDSDNPEAIRMLTLIEEKIQKMRSQQ